MTTKRTLTPDVPSVLTNDIRDHGYAVMQTRIERVPAHHRSTQCAELDGRLRCTRARPATSIPRRSSPPTSTDRSHP